MIIFDKWICMVRVIASSGEVALPMVIKVRFATREDLQTTTTDSSVIIALPHPLDYNVLVVTYRVVDTLVEQLQAMPPADAAEMMATMELIGYLIHQPDGRYDMVGGLTTYFDGAETVKFAA